MSESVAPTAKASKTVTVALKLPNGLRLRIYDMHEEQEASPLGARPTKVARQVGEEVVLKGSAINLDPQRRPEHPIVGGYGLTHGVDKEFFDRWMKENKDSMLVKNELIFAYGAEADTVSQAKDNASVKSNLEPLDPSMKKMNGRDVPVDPRFPKSSSPHLRPATEEERAA